METAVAKGLESLNWKSSTIDTYIAQANEVCRDLDMILTTVKDNVKSTVSVLKVYEKNLMFDRKEGRVYTYEELKDSFRSLVSMRHNEIKDAGKQITKLLSSSNRILNTTKSSPSWKAYTDYFQDIVVEGFVQSIACTCK